MSGYWNREEETKDALRDGWLVTNDLVYTDADGYVYMLGRADDIINIGGGIIFPLSNLILLHTTNSPRGLFFSMTDHNFSHNSLHTLPFPPFDIYSLFSKNSLYLFLEAGFTVAGMLMFGKNSSITDPECCPNFFPDYREHLGDGKDVRWTNRVYPDGTWEANLYQFYSRVLPMLQHALPVPFKLDENQRRKDTTSAHTSLREALGNCLIHCAYTVMGNIVIDRYDDRIVMSNPGTMLVSLEDFWEGGHSVCRNPLLQKMFVFVGVGEKAGSGADVISAGWRENGWQLPTLVEHQMPARVEATLLIEDLVKQQEGETIQKSGLETESNQKSDQKTGLGRKTIQKVTRKVDWK